MRLAAQGPSRRPSESSRFVLLAALLAAGALAACAPAKPPTPIPEEPLRAPIVRYVAAGDAQLEIVWRPTGPRDTYTVYWSTAPKLTQQTATKVSGLAAPRYIHKGLTNGTQYYYLITAVRDGRESTDPASTSGIPMKVAAREFPKFYAAVAQPSDSFESLADQYLKDPQMGGIIQDFNDLDAVEPLRALAIPREPAILGGLGVKSYQMVPVLTYHRFSLNTGNKMTVKVASFAQQMRFLKDNGYWVVPLDTFVNFLDMKAQLPEKAVVITADDGWKSFYEYAYPILKRYGYPATLFVYTDFPESDQLALTWNQIREMSANGVDIQCHSKSHRNLRMQKGEALQQYVAALETEMKTCQRMMKEKLGITTKYLAYPYGANNHLVVAMARKAGFKAAFTVDRGSNPFFYNDYRIRRSMVYGEYDLKAFERNLGGFDDKVLK